VSERDEIEAAGKRVAERRIVEAARAFAARFDTYVAGDVASSLACSEADALAAVLAACGEPERAEAWLDFHADSDDEGDAHWDRHGNSKEY